MDFYIRGNCKRFTVRQMAAMSEAVLGTGLSETQISAYMKNHKIVSGRNSRFEKGHIPTNKGKAWGEFMSPEAQANSRRSTFQPGHVPHNGGTPVGTIRLRKARSSRPGSKPYYWQKVAEPNVWRPKHAIEWEEHNGPVPEGCMVTFANGDTLNWQIGNLILETKAQHAVKNRHHLNGYDRESAQTANRIADLKMAASEARKRKRK